MSAGAPLLDRGDARPLLALTAASFALFAGTAVAAAQRAGVPFGALAAYYDGYLYLDIAKSFPLPFAPDALDYAGQAPGYPALAALAHALLPGAAGGWGVAMLGVAWLAGALSTAVFYALCRATGTPPLLPTLLFAVANPLRTFVVATAHPEPVATLFALASLVAFLRERPVACFAWLALATLTRYPALLLTAPLVLGFALLHGRRDARALAPAALPLVALALLHLYLAWRVPGFRNVWAAHGAFWEPGLTLPFSALAEFGPGLWATLPSTMTMTCTLLLAYLVSIPLGLREVDRRLWILPLWIATPVLFQLSLSGAPAVFGFARLTALAWPAAVVVLWRALPSRLPRGAVLAGAAALGAFGVWFAGANLATATRIQGAGPELERFVAAPDPVWLDLREAAGPLVERVRRAQPD